MNYYKILLCALCCLQSVAAQDDGAGKIATVAKGVPAIAGKLWTGIKGSVGICSPDHTYTMQAWNDAPVNMTFGIQAVTNFQGANIPSDSQNSSVSLDPYTHAPLKSKKINIGAQDVGVCHAIIHIDPSDFKRPLDVDPSDHNVYYYHAYALPNGPEGEFVGPGLYGNPSGTTAEFSGVFFNNLGTTDPVRLTFTKNGIAYNTTLEQYTFSLLDSDASVAGSIRPQTFNFTFAQGQKMSIPVQSLGLAQSFTDSKTNTTQTFPFTSTYEIFGNATNPSVCQQGFNMGNYNQPGVLDIGEAIDLINPALTEFNKLTPNSEGTYDPDKLNTAETALTTAISDASLNVTLGPIRDLNPVSCSLWCMSAQQAQTAQTTQDASAAFFDLPEQIWVAYVTKDQTITQKLTPGTVTQLQILRPLPSEETANLLVFSLDTTNDSKATQFLKNVANNPETFAKLLPTDIPNPNEVIDFRSILKPTLSNFFTDDESGVTGALLMIDTFTRYGGGLNSLRYYQIPPAILRIDETFTGLITPYLDKAKFGTQDPQTILQQKDNVPSWLADFQKNIKMYSNLAQINLGNLKANATTLTGLVPDLVTFLKDYGVASLLEKTGNLSDAGLRALFFILLGPASFNKPPLIRQAGYSTYLQEGKPDSWPTDKAS